MKVFINKEKKDSTLFKLTPEDEEDIWVIYNFIQKGDEIRFLDHRNITIGSTVQKMLIKIITKVESLDFEAASSSLRIKGRVSEQNDYLPLGSYHTYEVGFKYPVSVIKDHPDSYAFRIIKDAANFNKKAEIGAIIMQEGIAHLCLLTNTQKKLVAKVEKVIPKKRRGGINQSSTDSALHKFYVYCYNSMMKNFDLENLKVILIASPGDVAKNMIKVAFEEAAKENNKVLIANKQKIVFAHAYNGYLQSLDETLKNPEVEKQLQDTKYFKNFQLMEQFFKELNDETGRAFYGKDVCVKALAFPGAVKYLMLSDSLFRSDDLNERRYYVRLSDNAAANGTEVVIFSSLHDTGEQLQKMTGIAVILQYPMPSLEEDTDDEEDDEDTDDD